MEPLPTFIQQLLKQPREKINIFQCGHIITDENILPMCIPNGPSFNIEFDFSYKSRSDPKLVCELI